MGAADEHGRILEDGAMSTRDELAETVIAAVTRSRFDPDAVLPNDIADALIAEGWRKKPSRDEVARAIALGVDGVDGEQFDEAAVDYRLEMLRPGSGGGS